MRLHEQDCLFFFYSLLSFSLSLSLFRGQSWSAKGYERRENVFFFFTGEYQRNYLLLNLYPVIWIIYQAFEL